MGCTPRAAQAATGDATLEKARKQGNGDWRKPPSAGTGWRRTIPMSWSASPQRAWTSDHFRHTFAEIRAVAVAPRRHGNRLQLRHLAPCPSLVTAQFMDLRDTAVANLALAGNTIPGICAISGHSERAAGDILKHCRQKASIRRAVISQTLRAIELDQ